LSRRDFEPAGQIARDNRAQIQRRLDPDRYAGQPERAGAGPEDVAYSEFFDPQVLPDRVDDA
jgi:hypothetical protein